MLFTLLTWSGSDNGLLPSCLRLKFLFGPDVIPENVLTHFWGLSNELFHPEHSSIVLQTPALSCRSLELASTDTPCQCTDLQGSALIFFLSFTCCQGGQHEHNVSLFLCRPLSHALSVMGRVGLSWAVHVSGRMTKQSWARWHNLFLRSADRL